MTNKSIRLIVKGKTRYVFYKGRKYRIVSEDDSDNIISELKKIRKALEKRRRKRRKALQKKRAQHQASQPIITGAAVNPEQIQKQIDRVKALEAQEAEFRLRQKLQIQQDALDRKAIEAAPSSSQPKTPKSSPSKKESPKRTVKIDGVSTPLDERVIMTGLKMQARNALHQMSLKQIQNFLKDNDLFKGKSQMSKGVLISSIINEQPESFLQSITPPSTAGDSPTKRRKTTEDIPIIDFSQGNGLMEEMKKEMAKNGLWNHEIEGYMKNIKNFKGVYPIDMLKHLPIDKKDKHFSFIMNTLPTTSKEKAGHWVAVRCDKNTLEYCDSFGEPNSPQFMKNMKPILKKYNPGGVYQFKINRIQRQHKRKATCGYHAIRYIVDRENGKTFKEATGYDTFQKIIDKSKKGEAEVERFKKNIKKFGYVKA